MVKVVKVCHDSQILGRPRESGLLVCRRATVHRPTVRIFVPTDPESTYVSVRRGFNSRDAQTDERISLQEIGNNFAIRGRSRACTPRMMHQLPDEATHRHRVTACRAFSRASLPGGREGVGRVQCFESKDQVSRIRVQGSGFSVEC